ncbi:MAG: alpha/beta fold hydrolase [Pseudoclavibacter sp.]|nr:alpha/beta fold hydrolase [Pseudoclavibacter sp.]
MSGSGRPRLRRLVPRLVRLDDGRRLRVFETGPADGPRIVLEAGVGATAHSWAAVVGPLAGRARVCAYDRAGYGGSDPAPGRRDPARLAADLVELIDLLRAQDPLPGRPLVLVGHSLGGLIVRGAAAGLGQAGRPPTGIVLVDPSDERCDAFFAPLARLADSATALLLPALAAMRAAPPEPGGIPVRTLSGVHAPPGLRRMRAQLRAAHRASAAACADGAVIDAERSGHVVPFTEPRLVAETALALAAAGGAGG